MRQGAGYNDEARQDAMTQGRNNAMTQQLDDNETRGMTRDATQPNDVAWRCNGMCVCDLGTR